MSSRFSSLFSSYATPLLGEHLAEQDVVITYTPPGETAIPWENVILGEEKIEELETDDGRRERVTLEASSFRTAGSAFETTRPALNAVVTIGGVEWTVEAVTSWTENSVAVRLTRRPVMEQARTGYRKK